MKILSNNQKIKVFIVSIFSLLNANAAPKKTNGEKKEGVPKAKVVDMAKFNPLPLQAAPVPEDTEQLPQLNQAEDNYSVATRDDKSRREYFSVPEAVRNVREIARKELLLKSKQILFDYIREKQATQFPDQQKTYEDAVKRNGTALANILFVKSQEEFGTKLEALFNQDLELKEAITYLGLIRFQSIYGDFSNAPAKVQNAQKIEKAYHHFEEGTSEAGNLKKITGAGTEFITFNSQVTLALQKKDAKRGGNFGTLVRKVGMDLLWDLKDKLLPDHANTMALQFSKQLEAYVPYDRVYVDTFKRGAMAKGSPEFIAIWRYRGAGKVYRKELLAVGLVTTARSVVSPWHLTGQQPGAEGNTPDGVWRVFGFDKHYLGGDHDQYDMRGMTLLSYGNSADFNGRGFHLVFFSSDWGGTGSHGCIRVYTNQEEQAGLANVIWAAINPMQLDQVDFADEFTNENTYVETPLVREIVKTIRDRVWISVFSNFEEGYNFTGDATYSVQVRRQYDNFEQQNEVSPLFAAKKLLNERSPKIVGPSYTTTNKKGQTVEDFKTRTGKYWPYDSEIREKLFEINFRK